jgi:hypothetical protein
MNETPKTLRPALRQFRHNTDEHPGYVVAYDKQIVDSIYQSQAERIAELEQKNSEMFGELNRQELAIRDLRLRNQELREKGLTQK